MAGVRRAVCICRELVRAMLGLRAGRSQSAAERQVTPGHLLSVPGSPAAAQVGRHGDRLGSRRAAVIAAHQSPWQPPPPPAPPAAV